MVLSILGHLAYVQSDEISLLITNYQTLDTQSWFDNNLQKMISVAAGVASSTFTTESWRIWMDEDTPSLKKIVPAIFDARAFVLPKEDVVNYFLWRQQDATRNSVQMLARSLYSHKECTNKNNSELQELIFQKGIN
jgi:tRNA(His) 5'-end guanylyltransferase